MRMQHTDKVINGKLKQEALFLRELKNFEGMVVITVEKLSKKRSVQQNRYYWGTVIQMLWQKYTGAGYLITREQLHKQVSYKFLQDTGVNPITGEVEHYVKSTTELSTSGFMDYIAGIQEWAATELEVYIPDPNEFEMAEA